MKRGEARKGVPGRTRVRQERAEIVAAMKAELSYLKESSITESSTASRLGGSSEASNSTSRAGFVQKTAFHAGASHTRTRVEIEKNETRETEYALRAEERRAAVAARALEEAATRLEAHSAAAAKNAQRSRTDAFASVESSWTLPASGAPPTRPPLHSVRALPRIQDGQLGRPKRAASVSAVSRTPAAEVRFRDTLSAYSLPTRAKSSATGTAAGGGLRTGAGPGTALRQAGSIDLDDWVERVPVDEERYT